MTTVANRDEEWSEVETAGATNSRACYRGHSARSHINGRGLCLAKSCRLCLTYRRSNAPA